MKKYRLVKQEGNEIEVLGETVTEVDPKSIIMIKCDSIYPEELEAFRKEYEKLKNESVMILGVPETADVSKLILEEMEEKVGE